VSTLIENSPARAKWVLTIPATGCTMRMAGEAEASNAGVQLAKE
jgi:hypothetical protein